MTARQVTVAECGFNGSRLRGRRARWKKFMIKSDGKDAYTVGSPNSQRQYSVTLSNRGWACTCPWARHRKAHCKHIKAVENVCMLPEPEITEPLVVDPVPENQCPRCDATGATKAGVRKNKNYDNQIYKCRSCKHRFSANLGFEKLKCSPVVVSRVLHSSFSGKSASAIADELRDEMPDPPTQQTVCNWVRSRSRLAALFANSLNLCLGDKMRVDGMSITASGVTLYLHMAIDDATRYWLSYVMSPNKATDDVSALLLSAEEVYGKVPTLLVSDKDWAYHAAWEKTYRALNYLCKKVFHHRHVHAKGDINNNMMERFNGTVRAWINHLRGFKDGKDPILDGMRVHYNHVRPHQGLEGLTPGEAAGILVRGRKWRTLVQHGRLLQKNIS